MIGRTVHIWLAAQFFLIVWPTVLLAQTASDNPTGPTGVYNGNITTAGSYDPFTGNQMRVVDDIVVPGSVGAYPLKWTRYYNTNVVDGQWTFSYKDYKGDKLPDGRQLPDSPFDGKGVADFTSTAVWPDGLPYTTIFLADGGRVKLKTQVLGSKDPNITVTQHRL